MKLTKSHIKQLIKEELETDLNETQDRTEWNKKYKLFNNATAAVEAAYNAYYKGSDTAEEDELIKIMNYLNKLSYGR